MVSNQCAYRRSRPERKRQLYLLRVTLDDLIAYPGLGGQGQFATGTYRPTSALLSQPFSPSVRARANQPLMVVGCAPDTLTNSFTLIPDCLRRRTTTWRSICLPSIVKRRTSILSKLYIISQDGRVFKGLANNETVAVETDGMDA
jgi:hypothetical protein